MWNSPKDVNIFPPESNIFNVGLSKHVLTKQTAQISTFNIRNITSKISKHRQHYESQSCTGSQSISTNSSNVKNNVKRQRLSVDAQGPT